MKISKQHFNKLVSGTAAMCGTYYREVWESVDGYELIRRGVTQVQGKDVKPKGRYKAVNPKGVKINHERAIKAIINAAKSVQQMENDLAEYVCKYPIRHADGTLAVVQNGDGDAD